MATLKKRVSFFESEEGVEVKQTLRRMAKDGAFNTESTYNANAEKYPDHLISFVEKHMHYLNTHPSIDPNHYLANLRLMTRIR